MDAPKVILAVQHPDGSVTALAGTAANVEIEMERDEPDYFMARLMLHRVPGPARWRASVEFLGAVQYQHMADWEDIPDPPRPPAGELENRRAIEAARKEIEG